MVVARSCRRRRSVAPSSCSPTSLTLPPDGTSEPFCSSPITVSAVTDFPEPLSPTRQSVSRSRTCSETASITRSPWGLLPSLTTRSLMSSATPDAFIAHRHRGDVAGSSLAALPLLHARIERVTCGVADQVYAEDGDRQQQAGPEDQRRLDLEISAPLSHDIAPCGGLRADAGAEKRQDRLGQNGGGANIRALDDQRRNGVRHQVPPHDLGQAGADGNRRF